MNRKGFTLVELSIVLVIIGLLIGGILAAQSMIRTTKIQGFVRQIEQFDIAVYNFQTKFKGLPGDTPVMGCNTYSANMSCNDGMIECSTSYYGPNWFVGETADFWPVLQRGVGFNPPGGGTFSSVPKPSFNVKGTTVHAPALNIAPNTGAWVSAHSPYTDWVNWQNYYFIVDNVTKFTDPADEFCATCQYYNGGATIPAPDALAIDTKLDDGKAELALNSVVAELEVTGSTCASGDVYSNNSADLCALQVRMFGKNSTIAKHP